MKTFIEWMEAQQLRPEDMTDSEHREYVAAKASKRKNRPWEDHIGQSCKAKHPNQTHEEWLKSGATGSTETQTNWRKG